MRETKKKILVICPYPENVAPSQRLKFEQYYNFFRESGYDLEVRPYISEAFWKIIYKKGFLFKKIWYTFSGYLKRLVDIIRASRCDVVYIHLWVTPFGPPLFEWLVRKVSKKIVYDIDDLVYLRNVKSNAHPLVTFFKGRKKPLYLMGVSDHVITCTPYLDSFVKKYNNHTTDISSTINTDIYKPKNNYQVNDKIIIGWSGSHSTSKYLHLLDNVFKKVSLTNKFKLLVMGDPNFKIEGVDVEAIPWKEEYEVETISRFDIGVYPLPDEEWVLGKSGLKALQYMALGLPTIATKIGTIHRIINHQENGFLVSNLSQWEQVIIQLINDKELREMIGKKATLTVAEKYSVNVNKQVYLSILNTLTV